MLGVGGELSPLMPMQHSIDARTRHRFALRRLSLRFQARDDDYAAPLCVMQHLVERGGLLGERGFGVIS